MNVVTTIDNYHINNVFFSDPIKNTVINDSDFVRIIYSNDEVVLNGIYLYVYLANITLESYYIFLLIFLIRKIATKLASTTAINPPAEDSPTSKF